MRQKKDVDPDVAELRRMLPDLQAAVAEGALTPLEANTALGRVADSLAKRKRR